MTEEVKQTEEVIEEPVYTEVEQVAMSQGWLPKEQWVESGRSESEWRSAREFKDRGELLGTIHSLKRENKQTQATLTALQKHHQYVFDQAHRKALAELRQDRRQALRDENFDRVEEIEDQIETTETEYAATKAELVKEQQVAQAAETPPEFQAWMERNHWYTMDQELRDEADAIGIVYAKRNPGIAPSTVLAYVEKEVRRKNPEKFGVKKAASNAVTPSNRVGSKKTTEVYQLTELEEKIANDLVRGGVMTRDEYVKELKKVKGE